MSAEEPPQSPEDEEILSPEEAEARIAEFIEGADVAGGPSTADLADEVLVHVRRAWDELATITGAQSNNKIVAMMLELSRRARAIDPSTAEYWITSAASSLVSGQIPAARPERSEEG
jgi:hypothetical protein